MGKRIAIVGAVRRYENVRHRNDAIALEPNRDGRFLADASYAQPRGMTAMVKYFPVLSLATLLAVGCGAATTKKDSWEYSGPDAMLKSPAVAMSEARRREVAEDLGGKQFGMPSEAMQQKFREDFEAWKRKYLEALRGAREACARETGESETPSLLTGYSKAFVACMNARGWSRPTGSNPL